MLAGGCGHQQRRGETNRRGGGERHPADRDDEDEVADQHSASTARAEHRAAASPASAGHSAAKYDQHDDQVPGKAGPDDLHDRVVRGQQFDCGVHEREHRDAEAHQRDAAQHVGGRQCRRRPAPARRPPGGARARCATGNHATRFRGASSSQRCPPGDNARVFGQARPRCRPSPRKPAAIAPA